MKRIRWTHDPDCPPGTVYITSFGPRGGLRGVVWSGLSRSEMRAAQKKARLEHARREELWGWPALLKAPPEATDG